MRVVTTFGAFAAFAAVGSVPAAGQHSPEKYDYVIVGGGLTGLVAAARLTEDPDVSVLVLEYGTIDRSNVTQIPYYVRASQLAGGGSQVNGMQWYLPSGADFDAFAKLGNPGWDWKGLRPYYKKATQLTPQDPDIEAKYNYSYDVLAHGGPQSPAKISFPEFQYLDMYPFKDAFTELRLPFVEDPASGNATRTSSLYAYYDRVSHRKNLKLFAKHQVIEVTFDKHLTATGVKALNRDLDQPVTFAAGKEVILAAGAIFTPQILQLSGIGPKSVLDAAGVKTKLNFPAVGSNFQDHPTAFLSWNITNQFPNPRSLLTNATSFEEALKLYFNALTEPMTKAQSSYVGFLSLSSITENAKALLADAETQSTSDFLPEVYSKDKCLVDGFKAQRDVLIKAIRAGDVAVLEVPIPGGGLIPNAVQKPFSRGTVHLNASDPTGVPAVLHNSLAHPFDRAAIFGSLKFTCRLVNSKAVAPLQPVEVTPGAQYTEQDATIEQLITSGALTPTFSHPSCSCPMMPQHLGGVVDSELRVYGTQKLSIIDASILPVIPAAHLQATMYSMAEKAADIVKARAQR